METKYSLPGNQMIMKKPEPPPAPPPVTEQWIKSDDYFGIVCKIKDIVAPGAAISAAELVERIREDYDVFRDFSARIDAIAEKLAEMEKP